MFSRIRNIPLFIISFILVLGFATSGLAADVVPAPRDTINIFGGPDTLEGKFQTAEGQPDKQGWESEDASLNGVGDFTQLWVGLDDDDPDQVNHSPQWAFLDDGLVVPDCGPSYCNEGLHCYGPDGGLVTNQEGGAASFGSELSIKLRSPIFALPSENGHPVLSLDAYLDNGGTAPYFDDVIAIDFGLEATTDPTGQSGWHLYASYYYHARVQPQYVRMTLDLDEEVMPPGQVFARVVLMVMQIPGLGLFAEYPTPAPYLDNVRVQWVPEATSSVGLVPGSGLTLSAVPNPFNPATVINFEAPEGQLAKVRIFDLRGREVANLFEGPVTGPARLEWHGRDKVGRAVPAGIYLCMAESGGHTQTLKVTLAK